VRWNHGDVVAVFRVHESRTVQSQFDEALWIGRNADLHGVVSVAGGVYGSVVYGRFESAVR
jgi:hypothetical protein